MIRIYFWWKCFEIVAVPVLTIVELSLQRDSHINKAWPISAFVLMIVRILLRIYFLYIIFSFIQRVERGEALLVEYGSRRLNRMIDEIKKD